MKPNLAGIHGQKTGSIFENIFEFQCNRHQVAVTRIPDSCRTVYNRRARKWDLERIKSPFDWTCSFKNYSAMIDTKTTQERTLPHSAIESHQVASLMPHGLVGVTAGYVVWARKTDTVFFIPVGLLDRAYRSGPGSIGPENEFCRILGTSSSLDARLLFPVQ